jgi:hypothetical protein
MKLATYVAGVVVEVGSDAVSEEDEDRGRWGSAPCIYQELRWDPPL